jgi:hypothetical protein
VGLPLAGGLALVVGLLGISLRRLLSGALDQALLDVKVVIVQGLPRALEATTWGLGTGIDTRASRHFVSDADLYGAFGGVWQESWWVKALLELGAVGLVVVVALWLQIVARGWYAHHAVRDVRLGSVSAALLALVLWIFVYHLKAQYLDLDPFNVYFWLLLGVLFRVPDLDRRAARVGPG